MNTNKNTDPNFTRPEVTESIKRWRMVSDCVAGAHAIKAAKTKYLPQPNADDTSEENRKRYTAYLQRAFFFGVTSRTLVGLVGQVFTKEPQFELPKELIGLRTSIDGRGTSHIQFAKTTVSKVLQHGRAGILADCPNKADGSAVTMQDIATGRFDPFLRFYEAEEIINWRTDIQDSIKYLSLLVLREQDEVPDGEFGIEHRTRFRIFKCDGTSVTCEVREQPDASKQEFVIVSPAVTMTNAAGDKLKRIPFSFIGAEDNTERIGSIPLYDMADANVSHFQNSADAEESSFLTGQPTPVLTGLTEDWVSGVLKNQVRLGSRSAVFLPVGGSAELLQAEPNSLPVSLMERKEKQMIALGAKIVESKSIQRTATEVSVDANADQSVLSSVVHNVNAAMVGMLRIACQFRISEELKEEDVVYEINTDFAISRMGAQERAQLIAEWQAGALDYEEVRSFLKRIGVAYKDDKAVKLANEEEIDHDMQREQQMLETAMKMKQEKGAGEDE